MPIRDRLLILGAILLSAPTVLALGIVLAVAGAVRIVAQVDGIATHPTSPSSETIGPRRVRRRLRKEIP